MRHIAPVQLAERHDRLLPGDDILGHGTWFLPEQLAALPEGEDSLRRKAALVTGGQ